MTTRLPRSLPTPVAVVRLWTRCCACSGSTTMAAAVIAAETHLRRFSGRGRRITKRRRMLAAVLLSQHRFAEAIARGHRAQATDPRDAWNYGAIGDGYMELGDYDRAFEAFDRMGQLAPGAASVPRPHMRSKSRAISTALWS